MLTFLPLEEISDIEKKTASGDGKAINGAKERLAFELTKLVHGEEEAEKALNTDILFLSAALMTKTCLLLKSAEEFLRRDSLGCWI